MRFILSALDKFQFWTLRKYTTPMLSLEFWKNPTYPKIWGLSYPANLNLTTGIDISVILLPRAFRKYTTPMVFLEFLRKKTNLPQNMRVILSAFDNFEFDNRDHHFWYTLTEGFPKIYHTYGVSWIFEKPNLPQNMGVIRLSAFDNFEFDNWDHHFWYSLTQGFPKIYHTYGVSWIFEKNPTYPKIWGLSAYPLWSVGDGWVVSGSVDSGCHKLSENVWFVWSKIYIYWHKCSCYRCGTNNKWI